MFIPLDSSIQGRVELFDPGSNAPGSANATGPGQDALLGGLVVSSRFARPRGVDQTCPALAVKAGTLSAHGSRTQAQVGGYLLRSPSRCGFLHDAGPLYHALLRGGLTHPTLQRFTFLLGQFDSCHYSRHVWNVFNIALYWEGVGTSVALPTPPPEHVVPEKPASQRCQQAIEGAATHVIQIEVVRFQKTPLIRAHSQHAQPPVFYWRSA
ncbi:hypothetical protein ACFLX9_01135 [Chloroflexota bacterium]